MDRLARGRVTGGDLRHQHTWAFHFPVEPWGAGVDVDVADVLIQDVVGVSDPGRQERAPMRRMRVGLSLLGTAGTR